MSGSRGAEATLESPGWNPACRFWDWHRRPTSRGRPVLASGNKRRGWQTDRGCFGPTEVGTHNDSKRRSFDCRGVPLANDLFPCAKDCILVSAVESRVEADEAARVEAAGWRKPLSIREKPRAKAARPSSSSETCSSASASTR